MQQVRPGRGRVSAWCSSVLPGIALLFLSTTLLQAQDVADAARQEQARKTAEKTTPKHVYTDDDLKKDKILTPEDEAKVAARKHQPAQTAEQAKTQQQQPTTGTSESLGEIARRYRKEKAAREAEEAAKKSYTPFLYEVPQAATAAPRAKFGPVTGVAPNLERPDFSEMIRPNLPSKQAQGRAANRRVSPFEPRPFVGTRPPIVVNSLPPAPPPVRAPQPAQPVSQPATEYKSESGLKRVTVLRGDSWWKLAEIYLGKGSRWNELRALNPEVGGAPEALLCGAKVFVPDGKTLHVDSPQRTERTKQLRIKAGDTLWTLAREHLGRGSAWTCLAKANPQIQDYRHMTIGTVVDLPKAGGTASCVALTEELRR